LVKDKIEVSNFGVFEKQQNEQNESVYLKDLGLNGHSDDVD
jgi:hypothetical protein